MLFCLGFLFQFLIAGLTGVMLGVAPFDWQLTDSYFVVAHFHYTLVGGFLFMIFAAIYYWYPKAIGRMLNRKLGLWHFWLFAIGFHLTFDPQHFAGILGMPRRIYLRSGPRVGALQPTLFDRGALASYGHSLFCGQSFLVRAERRSGRR
jgi:cytochrome c oxidase subunit 1